MIGSDRRNLLRRELSLLEREFRRQGRHGFSRHKRDGLRSAQGDLDHPFVGSLVVGQRDRAGIEQGPGLIVDPHGRDRSGAGRGQVESFGAETDREMLLQPADSRRNVRKERQPLGSIEILEESPEQCGRRTEIVVAEIDRLAGLIRRIAEVHEGIVHAEWPGEFHQLAQTRRASSNFPS